MGGDVTNYVYALMQDLEGMSLTGTARTGGFYIVAV